MTGLLILAFLFFIGCCVAFAVIAGVLTVVFKLILFAVLLPFLLLGLVFKSLLWVILLPFKLFFGMLRVIF